MPRNQDHIAATDLLGRPPGWLLRSGIALIFGIVLLALVLAAFVRYPDKLSGPATIRFARPPVAVSASVSAPLDTLLVADGDTVAAGHLLAVLGSDADWRAVLRMDTFLNQPAAGQDGHWPQLAQLGSLQAAWAGWVDAQRACLHHAAHNGLAQELAAITAEEAHTRELMRITAAQLALQEREVALETKDYGRQQSLATDGVISPKEMEDKEKAWLGVRRQRENLAAALVQHRVRLTTLAQQAANADRTEADRRFALEQLRAQQLAQVRGQLQGWRERHLLQAPIAGRVALATDPVEKQRVEAGAPLLSVIPAAAADTRLTATIRISTQGMGKVRPGNRVVLQLDAYPEAEYGTVAAVVRSIAPLPQDDPAGTAYHAVVATLPSPLTTQYGKPIPALPHITGTALVITEDRSLLTRIFEQFLRLVSPA